MPNLEFNGCVYELCTRPNEWHRAPMPVAWRYVEKGGRTFVVHYYIPSGLMADGVHCIPDRIEMIATKSDLYSLLGSLILTADPVSYLRHVFHEMGQKLKNSEQTDLERFVTGLHDKVTADESGRVSDAVVRALVLRAVHKVVALGGADFVAWLCRLLGKDVEAAVQTAARGLAKSEKMNITDALRTVICASRYVAWSGARCALVRDVIQTHWNPEDTKSIALAIGEPAAPTAIPSGFASADLPEKGSRMSAREVRERLSVSDKQLKIWEENGRLIPIKRGMAEGGKRSRKRWYFTEDVLKIEAEERKQTRPK